MTRFGLAGILIMTAAPAIAQTAPAAPQSQPVVSTDKSDVNRVVCRREEVIGSRLGAKRVCLSVREWQDRVEGDRERLERIQHATPVSPSG